MALQYLTNPTSNSSSNSRVLLLQGNTLASAAAAMLGEWRIRTISSFGL
jgi:hypothetical protein